MHIPTQNAFFLLSMRILRDPGRSRVHKLGFWQDFQSSKTNIQRTLHRGEGMSCWNRISSGSTPGSWEVKALPSFLGRHTLGLCCRGG